VNTIWCRRWCTRPTLPCWCRGSRCGRCSRFCSCRVLQLAVAEACCKLDGEDVIVVRCSRLLRRIIRPVPLALLVEHHVPCYVNTMRHGVVRTEHLGSALVADEDHLAALILEFLEVWLHVPHVDDAAESLQVVDRRLLPIPSFECESSNTRPRGGGG
jgi:hypothetical protein